MILIDGKNTAADIKKEIQTEVAHWRQQGYRPPNLVAVLVGNDPASLTYVRSKERQAKQIGFNSSLIQLPFETTEQTLLNIISKLNHDTKVDGYIIQLPLPSHIDSQKVIMAIDPHKDVDGFHPLNLGKMLVGLPAFLPATPYGIIELIKRYDIPTDGKDVLIIGRSLIVGRPLSILLSQKRTGGNATVTLAHSHTKNLKHHSLKADIIITALGQPNFLKADMVKDGVVIIDAGINELAAPETKRGYRLVGDVDFKGVSLKASYITPVPGGVGPMTIAMLLKNTWKAYKLHFKLS